MSPIGYSVLAVDDSPLQRTVVARTLRLAEIPVTQFHEASDGVEAIAVLKKSWVDLVVTDLNMPRMTGVELVAQLAEDGLLKSVPVIILSSLGEESTLEGLKSMGVRACLRKPVTPEELLRAVKKVMEVPHVR